MFGTYVLSSSENSNLYSTGSIEDTDTVLLGRLKSKKVELITELSGGNIVAFDLLCLVC